MVAGDSTYQDNTSYLYSQLALSVEHERQTIAILIEKTVYTPH